MADKMAFGNDKVAGDNGGRTLNSIVRGRGAKHYPICSSRKKVLSCTPDLQNQLYWK